jgi:iron-sulfur cluster assembly protein
MDLAEPSPGDEVVEQEGARVIIDAKAVLYLLGTRMDVKTDQFSSTFVFENPNQTSACGCGESVALTPADPARVG